jgi:hypothetical protein
MSASQPPRRYGRIVTLIAGEGGGRIWWAHFEFTRINITPTILPKKIEE